MLLKDGMVLRRFIENSIFRERGFTKKHYIGGLKQGAWIVCRFNGGLGEKEGCGVFEGGG